MKKWGVAAIAATVMLLAGCSASVGSIAETCGGENAGITERDGVLTYQQSLDGTDTAWMCVLREAGVDKDEQYAIALSLDGGSTDISTKEFGSRTVRWASNDTTGILIEVSG